MPAVRGSGRLSKHRQTASGVAAAAADGWTEDNKEAVVADGRMTSRHDVVALFTAATADGDGKVKVAASGVQP